MKKVILFGAPGSGKGTQANDLRLLWGVPSISLGDLLRAEVKNSSPLGLQAKGYMDKGQLVPDALLGSILEPYITAEGFIIDGYPRTLGQAENLHAIFQRKNIVLDAMIYFEIDEPAIVNRLSRRRVCKACGAIYHLENMPPKTSGICDVCAGELIQRSDDTADVIKKRWLVFQEQAQPIVEFYRAQKKLLTVDGRCDKSLVFESIKKHLG